MNRGNLALVKNGHVFSTPITYEEKLLDHNSILRSYITTHITRNHAESTINRDENFLWGWFQGDLVEDNNMPNGVRQRFVWEAMEPRQGRQRVIEYGTGLLNAGLNVATVRGYLGMLRRLFAYVLEFPYIPNTQNQSIGVKYGTIEQPVSEYDYPTHVIDSKEEGIVLTGDKLYEFYEFVRLDYVKSAKKKLPAKRDYVMVIVAGESGLRADEIRNLDCDGPHRDIFYDENKLQTRFGKGFKGSGKRVRQTILTKLAATTMEIYEDKTRLKFKGAEISNALFLTEMGTRVSYSTMWRGIDRIRSQARKAGIELPPTFGWHSLRKSFATNFAENHPRELWFLMEAMGHINPSTLYRYVIHSKSYFDEILNRIVSDMMSPAGK